MASEQNGTKGPGRLRPNYLGGLGGWLWLAIIIVPIYYVVVTSLKNQAGFFTSNPMMPPTEPTLDNYKLVLDNDFAMYFANSLIVTVGSVVPALLVSFMAAYAIVRGKGRFLTWTNNTFLLGLAIPLHATIIPIYWMITKAHLYDTLLALILPSIAFAIPISVLILSNFMRDVPNELFESMRLDGCSDWAMMWRLALPMTRPAVVTVGIYNALGRLERLPVPADPDPEPVHPRASAVLVDLPGRIQREHPRRAGFRGARHLAAAGHLCGGPPPAAQRADRRIQQIANAL